MGDDWGNYTLWRTAPLTCDGAGWALLGEPSKFISVSRQRVADVRVDCGAAPAMEVDLVGAAGEAVELSFVSPRGRVRTASYVLDGRGRATADTRVIG